MLRELFELAYEFTGWLLQDSGDDLGPLRHTDRAVELAEASELQVRRC
jgi:hypothetical protein